MIGELNTDEIEHVLYEEVLGRIGCHANDTTYIVPICYAYDGKTILARSIGGLKIDIMRQNPKVCFEVESVQDMANWKTVILWGSYIEITDVEERKYALDQLLYRQRPMVTGQMSRISPNWPFHNEDYSDVDGIVYKILITKKTGRFENYQGTQKVSQSYL